MSYFFSLIILHGTLSAIPHPIHVSVTEIYANTDQKDMEIVISVFLDDLKKAIKDIKHPKNGEDPKTKMVQYITNNFKLTDLENNSIDLKVTDIEWSAPAIIFEFSGPYRGPGITVENHILHNVFKDQTNIVHFDVDGKRISQSFRKNDKPKYLSVGG